MTSLSAQEATDEPLFHAIGEFVVRFSHLTSITEHLTATLISHGGSQDAYKRARIAVSNLTAQPLANAFFAVLKEFETPTWTANDQAILKCARTELDSLIAERNRFAHDSWHLGHPNLPRPSIDSWHRVRTTGTQTAGLRVDFDVIPLDFIRTLIGQTTRIDTVIRTLSLAGIAGDTSRPELLLELTNAESGTKQVDCIKCSADG